MAKIEIFGVTTGFEVYPEMSDTTYFQQFDNRNVASQWKFFIRQYKNTVRYIYIRYDLMSGIDRAKSLFGICVELPNQYITSVKTELLPVFEAFYENLITDGVLLSRLKNSDKIKFQVASFQVQKEYIDKKISILKDIDKDLSDDIIKLTTNTEQFAPNQIAQYNVDVSDDIIIQGFQKYGGVNIVPTLITRKKEVISLPTKEADYLKTNKQLEEQVKELQKQLESQKNSVIPTTPAASTEAPITTQAISNVNSSSDVSSTTESPANKQPIPKVNPHSDFLWEKYQNRIIVVGLIVLIGIFIVVVNPPNPSDKKESDNTETALLHD